MPGGGSRRPRPQRISLAQHLPLPDRQMGHDLGHGPAARGRSAPHLVLRQAANDLEEPCAGLLQPATNLLFPVVGLGSGHSSSPATLHRDVRSVSVGPKALLGDRYALLENSPAYQ
jgi:hypothetical protein